MDHNHYMQMAIIEAKKAELVGEVPIGAIIVADNKIIAQGYNQKELLQDPTAHAEIIAIKEAAKVLKSWRLTNAVLYVTLEPCVMCAGAIVQARLAKVVYGASDLKGGACGTCFNLVYNSFLNHQTEVIAGIMEEECSQIIRDFFKKLRR